jgi:hypothetical protein
MQHEVIERFLTALGEVKQLANSSGDRYVCFGCPKPICRVYWDVDAVCGQCYRLTHQSGDWTGSAIENLQKRVKGEA